MIYFAMLTVKAALEQLSCTLEYHKSVFKATQTRLAGGQCSTSGATKQASTLTRQTGHTSTSQSVNTSMCVSDKDNSCDEQLQR